MTTTTNRVVTLDLADAGAVERLWAEVERIHAARAVAPELSKTLRCAAGIALDAGRLTRAEHDELVHALGAELVHPRAVLSAWIEPLAPNRPALGAFPRRATVAAPTAEEWLLEEPHRLAGVVAEMARFGSPDWHRIARSVGEVADRAGIPEDVAVDVIAEAIRSLREVGR